MSLYANVMLRRLGRARLKKHVAYLKHEMVFMSDSVKELVLICVSELEEIIK